MQWTTKAHMVAGIKTPTTPITTSLSGSVFDG